MGQTGFTFSYILVDLLDSDFRERLEHSIGDVKATFKKRALSD